ncbi:MAG: succinate dehydrogenase iron-sulfur subunit [Thermoplasmata archaeon]|nr:succinate dehydrogenase iron-sulfur subunit [Thermoplasmata archaeon]
MITALTLQELDVENVVLRGVIDLVVFRIFRFDPARNDAPTFQTYDLPDTAGMTILDALIHIKENMDSTLSFRRSCRSAICGSCAICANGKNLLACNTQVNDLKKVRITLEPLPGFPMMRDLVVDWEPFFDQYRSVKPYMVARSTPPEKERIQDQKTRKAYDEAAQCIMCSACTSSCPVVWTDGNYLGPAALTKAWRFVADDRDEITRERLAMVNNEEGVWRCHTIFRCTDSCPKKIDTAGSIESLRKKIIWHQLTGRI